MIAASMWSSTGSADSPPPYLAGEMGGITPAEHLVEKDTNLAIADFLKFRVDAIAQRSAPGPGFAAKLWDWAVTPPFADAGAQCFNMLQPNTHVCLGARPATHRAANALHPPLLQIAAWMAWAMPC